MINKNYTKKQLLKQQHYINYSKVNKNENYILYNYTLFMKQVIIIFFTWIMLLIKKDDVDYIESEQIKQHTIDKYQ